MVLVLLSTDDTVVMRDLAALLRDRIIGVVKRVGAVGSVRLVGRVHLLRSGFMNSVSFVRSDNRRGSLVVRSRVAS